MKPIIAISSCILGNHVRYDGGHTHNEWVTQNLANSFQLKAICPEMEMGLGSPRETMNLIDFSLHNKDIRLMTTITKKDFTILASRSIETIISRDLNGICGHIFQQKSPSCGIEKVKLYNEHDQLINSPNNNSGLYAKKVIERFPYIPVIESINLTNIDERKFFLFKVMAYFNFHAQCEPLMTIESLQDFHTHYKVILMQHCLPIENQLHFLAFRNQQEDLLITFTQYKNIFLKALSLLPLDQNDIHEIECINPFLAKLCK